MIVLPVSLFLLPSFTKCFSMTAYNCIPFFKNSLSLSKRNKHGINFTQHVLFYWHIWARSLAWNIFFFYLDYLSVASTENYLLTTKYAKLFLLMCGHRTIVDARSRWEKLWQEYLPNGCIASELIFSPLERGHSGV